MRTNNSSIIVLFYDSLARQSSSDFIFFSSSSLLGGGVGGCGGAAAEPRSWGQDKTECFLKKNLFVMKDLVVFGITQNYILCADNKLF